MFFNIIIEGNMETPGISIDKIDDYLTNENLGHDIDDGYGEFVISVLEYLKSKGVELTEEEKDNLSVGDLLKKARDFVVKDSESGDDVGKEEVSEPENEKKLIWYDGIVDDLLTITNPRLHLKDIRTPVKEKMMKLGIDVQSFIDRRNSENIDESMMLLRDAAFVVSGRYDKNSNRWRKNPQEAYVYLRECLGIGREEDAVASYQGMKIDMFLANLPNPRDIEGYEERVARLAQAGVVI